MDETLVRVGRGGRSVARAERSFGQMLDTVRPVAESFVGRFRGMANAPGGAAGVEDRLLMHERRYWEQSAASRGLSPALTTETLDDALAAASRSGCRPPHGLDPVGGYRAAIQARTALRRSRG
ncbi:hypothetical protein M1203_36460 [Streptomyces sp. 35G-GA-8]|nr:hypothetical protein [Streptomyces sp. 35G-GA-8]